MPRSQAVMTSAARSGATAATRPARRRGVEAFAVVCARDRGDERAHHLAGELVGAHVSTQSLDFVAGEGVLSRRGDRDIENLPVFRVFFGGELELMEGVGVAHRGARDNRPAMIVGESRSYDGREGLLVEQRELV